MGYSEPEWRAALVRAVGTCPMHVQGQHATVEVGQGHVRIAWTVLPNRTIALLSMPRMQVEFVFDAVDEPARLAFMRFFDLTVQRGGG